MNLFFINGVIFLLFFPLSFLIASLIQKNSFFNKRYALIALVIYLIIVFHKFILLPAIEMIKSKTVIEWIWITKLIIIVFVLFTFPDLILAQICLAFGLFILIQKASNKGKPFLPVSVGWILIMCAIILHITYYFRLSGLAMQPVIG